MSVIGIDEVGRGCLAGPVVAAGVIMSESALSVLEVDDSKKLSAKKRHSLMQKIIQSADAWSIGVASVDEIDQINILQASLLAMRRAVIHSPIQPKEAWVDGRDNPGLSIPTKTVINGDATVPLISCASIVAKVFRDELMAVYAREYPGYGLERHMGYGTAAHLQAIDALGVTMIHRRSFRPIAERVEVISS
jgi:ribonuclease HII